MSLLSFGLVTVREKGLPMNQSHDDLRSHLHKALRVAHGVLEGEWTPNGPSIMDTFPSHVVYSHNGGLHKRSYTATYAKDGEPPTITMGDPKPVHRAYADTKAGATEAEAVLLGEDEPVTEAQPDEPVVVTEGVTFEAFKKPTVKEAGKALVVPVKIIGPGWGSMAYYSKEMLQRDGPKVFTKGTHMMWNHASESEEQDRPEGNLDNLAAVLTNDAVWKESGAKGPGLYANAKVFSDYATQVAEKGPHIGVSINAAIRGREGTAEGRTGRIAEQLVRAFSTDFVTKAGAGGAPIVPVSEASRGPLQERTMTDQEVQERDAVLKENADLKARLAKIEESERRTLAVATVGAVLKEAGIPYRQPVLERLCQSPTMTDGKIDEAWVKAVVADFAGTETGVVEGFGETHLNPEAKTTTKTAKDRIRESLKNLGVPDAGLNAAVEGRA